MACYFLRSYAVATYDVVNKSHQSGKKAILKHSEEEFYAVLAQQLVNITKKYRKKECGKEVMERNRLRHCTTKLHNDMMSLIK
mmetsp:Transcript_14823/g.14230  ORF Transcript_14823/g.14230 Transcript_14823/m.14230 type:complete len:83 (+) Transcript_14823:70-318(+)